MKPEHLYNHPNALASHYKNFRVSERLLLTGHSHQAWPDVAHEGHEEAWHDAAEHVDNKWQYAFDKAEQVRNGFARLMNDNDGYYTLGSNTHELLTRFLSALDLRQRPQLITTDGEFHSIRRQLNRLEEEGIEIIRVPSQPANEVAQRIVDNISSKTAAVLVSSVFYETGQICPHLSDVLNACQHHGAELLIDAYHHLNVIPFDLKQEKLQQAYIVGGGYKYCQLGEGNCFLRFPKDCQLRPIITGWFAEFEHLADAHTRRVTYPNDHMRFAGSTYDPISHYRATKVFDFFQQQKLSVKLLREVNQHQIELLIKRIDDMNLPANNISRNVIPLNHIGGFLALNSPHADAIGNRLKQHNVHCDTRGNTLRLGPAPYLSDQQLNQALDIFEDAVKELKLG